jgi:hypothetical protein
MWNKVVIIIVFILHQSIVSKMFLVDALLNTGYLLKSYRLVYNIFFPSWNKAVVLISWGIRNT